MKTIITEANNLLVSKIENELIDNQTIYPWRKYQRSIYLHSLRVHQIALNLATSEKVSKSD